MKSPLTIGCLLLLALLSACDQTPEAPETPAADTPAASAAATDPDWKTKLAAPPVMTFEPGDEYLWELQTNVGTLRLRLFTDTAPLHAASTIYLTEKGFYDDLTFHRVIPGFMAQGGDPLGTGTGNPGYAYDGEFDGGRSHDKAGILSMANAGPGTDGSQFFITFRATPFLDGKHTIFGEVVAGDDVLAALEAKGSRSGATSEPLFIEKARIIGP